MLTCAGLAITNKNELKEHHDDEYDIGAAA